MYENINKKKDVCKRAILVRTICIIFSFLLQPDKFILFQFYWSLDRIVDKYKQDTTQFLFPCLCRKNERRLLFLFHWVLQSRWISIDVICVCAFSSHSWSNHKNESNDCNCSAYFNCFDHIYYLFYSPTLSLYRTTICTFIIITFQ